jgi:hypothetical protein
MPNPYAEYLAELSEALTHPMQPGDPLILLHEAHDTCLRAELEATLSRS